MCLNYEGQSIARLGEKMNRWSFNYDVSSRCLGTQSLTSSRYICPQNHRARLSLFPDSSLGHCEDVYVCVCVCVCGHVYVVYEDTRLYNDMGMT